MTLRNTLPFITVLCLFVTVLFLNISGCGGGSSNTVVSQIPSMSPSIGSIEMKVNWPEEGLSAQLIPSDTVKIDIVITGIPTPITVTLLKGETSKTITDIPAGEVQLEFKALDANGKILSHRITIVKVVAGQIVSVNVILGITILSTGFVPSAITVNVGDVLYFVNNDTVPHVVSLTGLTNSGPISPGSQYAFDFTGKPYKNYSFTCDSFRCSVTVTGGVDPLPPTEVPTGFTSSLQMVLLQGRQQFGMEDGGNDPNSSYQVKVSPYYICKYELTNSDYVKFLNENGNQTEGGVTWVNIVADAWCGIQGSGPYTVVSGYENRPVVYVSWYGAVAYCNWLSEKDGLLKCYGEPVSYPSDGSVRWGTNGANFHREYNGYRLPTEAEWEYACRGGDTSLPNFYKNYYWGDSLDATIGINKCWYEGLSPSPTNHTNVGYGGSHPTGLYDMSGNVLEWCTDWLGWPYPTGTYTDYRGPDSGSYRIYRGGSWLDNASGCQSAFRNYTTPDDCISMLGFRPVRTFY